MAGERHGLLLETNSYGLKIYAHTITPCNKTKNRAGLSNLFFCSVFFAEARVWPYRRMAEA